MVTSFTGVSWEPYKDDLMEFLRRLGYQPTVIRSAYQSEKNKEIYVTIDFMSRSMMVDRTMGSETSRRLIEFINERQPSNYKRIGAI